MDRTALSVRQPWASLLICGLKTIEIRSWETDYRGSLFIHAARRVNERAMERFALKHLPVGALIGMVELVKIEPFTESTWETLADAHMQPGPFPPNHYAWHVTNPNRLAKPIPHRGNRGLFLISEDGVGSGYV